ncbi:leucyl aminopeptidase [Sphingomonas sp.]|uniref:leucyl aminopeptidase n=1 Tax=Sphingomonas sp. TaxID=28214 RepID=UPI0025F9B55B|nr:leucyl aminopeptidase [Sphingomonas sp.]
MRIDYGSDLRGDALVWCAVEAGDDKSSNRLTNQLASTSEKIFARAAAAARFSGKAKQLLEVLAPSFCEADRALLLGLGKAPGTKDWQEAGATLARHLVASGVREASVSGVPSDMIGPFVLGARLGAYRFDTYRPNLPADQRPRLESIRLVSDTGTALAGADPALDALAEGVILARDLVSEPSNILHPEAFAARAKDLEAFGVEVDILGPAELEALGMEAMLAVGRGSARASRLVVMQWRGAAERDAAPLTLVGKGVTFDSGGISIKPADNMEAMKGDMAGAAAVVGAMRALAGRQAPANVVGLVGLVENMPDGDAFRPGDILRSASGKTIEVLNTDAEGRLVLCDVLHYAQQKFRPKAIIDLATLTGAIVVALGNERAGLFSNNDLLANAIAAAGQESGEPVWRLPLDPAYDKLLDSEIADMKNLNTGGGAGSITAGQFLQRFIADDLPWAHIDIAGVAWKAKSNVAWEAGWATGFGVQLLDALVRRNDYLSA